MAGRGAARNGRGGYQKPSNPAAASGPGAMSQRTDGGAGDRQAVRPLPARGEGGGGYGSRQESVALQQSGPGLRAGGPAGPAAAPTGPPGAGAPPDIYAPTARPNEPITAGAQLGAGPGPVGYAETARDQAAALYQMTGDPAWVELLEDLDNSMGI